MSGAWARLSREVCRAADADNAVVVEETAPQGRARVRVRAPKGWRVVCLPLDHGYEFCWLAERKGADGIVLACDPDGRWQAHIVECKATVSDGKWDEIRAQFHGSRLRLAAVCGVLGIAVRAVTLHTAFRRDKIGVASPDPEVFEAEMVATPRRAPRDMWRDGWVPLDGFGVFTHRRVPLDVRDDIGHGTITLG